MIQEVKTKEYEMPEVEKEIREALERLKNYKIGIHNTRTLSGNSKASLEGVSEYLKTWYSDNALRELLFYRDIIPEYKNQAVLRIVLSRAARSARLITHYDLARPKKPVRETYWCIKHKRYCEPTNDAYKFIERYSIDTIERLKEFQQIRTKARMTVYQGDSRDITLPKKLKADGIFTSPPYVGVIDYHEQHRYAYELFNFPRLDDLEIGPAKKGAVGLAKGTYARDIKDVFLNMNKYLKDDAKIFIVANDKFNLYPDIGKECGYTLVDVFKRPVLMRTERTGNTYFESIFYFKKAGN